MLLRSTELVLIILLMENLIEKIWLVLSKIDGVDSENKKYKQFTLGGSTEDVDLSKAHPLVKEKGI